MKTIANDDVTNLAESKGACLRLVVKFRNLPPIDRADIINFFSKDDIIPWTQLQAMIPGITINRLFISLTPAEIDELTNAAKALTHTHSFPDFLGYYAIDCSNEGGVEEVLQMLRGNKNVELGYLIHDSTPTHSVVRSKNSKRYFQGYLGRAPNGIDAQYAWGIEGGDGRGKVRVIDIEQGWTMNHENVQVNSLPCTGVNYLFHDHGTATLGVILMQENEIAGRGITPKAKGYAVSQWRADGCLNNADAIMAAIAQLQFGDIILIEAQVRDSSYRKNLWPVEIHDATFQVIRLAQALGIIVIEAAGNGDLLFNLGKDLDQLELNGQRIFNRTDSFFRDSGAIIVAAASSGLPHQRIYNSNYGSRIDCYAWGENVVTAGNFPASSGNAPDTYTNQFCGTSSASAIIGGAAIAVQSVAEANYGFRLSPYDMRRILSSQQYGTPSANGHGVDKIGVMPDLKRIIDEALPSLALQRAGKSDASKLPHRNY